MLMKLTAARVKAARKHVGEIDPRSRNSSLRSQSIVIFFSQKKFSRISAQKVFATLWRQETSTYIQCKKVFSSLNCCYKDELPHPIHACVFWCDFMVLVFGCITQ
jgi:hypothetical protein